MVSEIMELVNRLLTVPEDALLSARCYSVGEQRLRNVTDFHLVRRYESGQGAVLTLESPSCGVLVTLRIGKCGSFCRVMIEPGNIIEYKSVAWRVMELSLLPRLLRTDAGSEGAYLLPLASGYLAGLEKRPHNVFRTRMYSAQEEWEKSANMNCFGLLQPGKNLLCIVEEGDFFCFTEAEFGRDGKNDLRAAFQIREKPGDMLRFDTLALVVSDAGERADYGDLARIYRTWFIERKGVIPLRERIAANPVLAYSSEALRMKIFMAQKFPYLPDGSAPVRVHTTCAQAGKILDDVKAAGIEKAVVTLVGWNLGGHDGAYPAHFPVEPAIGGEGELRELISHAKSLGFQIVPHDNWTDVYRDSPDFDYEYIARTEQQEPVAAGVWGGGQSYKACPLVQLQRFGFEFEKIRQLGFAGHYYMDAQSTVLWSCHSPRHPADARKFALGLTSITQIPRAIYGAVATENCHAYTVPFVDETARIRFGARLPESDLPGMRPVPFYHIALHGLILFQTPGAEHDDWRRLWLRGLAFGARPYMEVNWKKDPATGAIGGDYRTCLERIAEPYDVCYRELKYQTLFFASFREPVPGVYCAAYENGPSLTVNTTETAFENIPPLSWAKTFC